MLLNYFSNFFIFYVCSFVDFLYASIHIAISWLIVIKNNSTNTNIRIGTTNSNQYFLKLENQIHCF